MPHLADDLIDTKEAAKLYGASRQAIRDLVSAGKLEAEIRIEHGKPKTYVSQAALMAVIAARDEAKRASTPFKSSDDFEAADLKAKARFDRDQDRYNADRIRHLEFENDAANRRDRETQRKHEKEMAELEARERQKDRDEDRRRARESKDKFWTLVALGAALGGLIYWLKRQEAGDDVGAKVAAAYEHLENLSKQARPPSEAAPVDFSGFVRKGPVTPPPAPRTPRQAELEEALLAMQRGDCSPLDAWGQTATPEEQQEVMRRIAEIAQANGADLGKTPEPLFRVRTNRAL